MTIEILEVFWGTRKEHTCYFNVVCISVLLQSLNDILKMFIRLRYVKLITTKSKISCMLQ